MVSERVNEMRAVQGLQGLGVISLSTTHQRGWGNQSRRVHVGLLKKIKRDNVGNQIKHSGSNMQQQMLAFPGRNHFHELVEFKFLDFRVHGDEFLAQHLVQIRLAAQPIQRLAQAARQRVR